MGLMNLLVGCVGSGVAHLDMCALIMSRYRSKLCLWWCGYMIRTCINFELSTRSWVNR